MDREFDRRTVLRGSLVLVAAGALGSCSPDADPTPQQPTLTPPSPTPATGTASSRPELTQSFGPNGTHFPEDVPWMGDTAAIELISDCTWEDIARQVSSVATAQVNEGVVIRVRPGTLPGEGPYTNSPPVLQRVGNPNWRRNVLICPLEGFGTVTIENGIRISECSRLSFYGFLSEDSFVLTNCTSVQVGWSRFSGMGVTRGGTDIAFYELVLGFRRSIHDTAGVRPTDDYEMTDILRSGCLFGPTIKPEDSDAHCDTIQAEGTGTGEFGPLISVDCVDYGSTNAAELLHGGLNRAEYRHCLILAARLPWRVYPLQPGDYDGTPNAFASRCDDVRLFDCHVVGPIGTMGFTDVRESTLNYSPAPNQQPTKVGEWIVDESTGEWTREDMMNLQALSDYSNETLAATWEW